MPTHGTYLYGFIRADEPKSFGPIGIEGVDVSTVPYRDIAAVISALPPMAFDAMPKETLLRYLTIYQSVLETVLKTQQIIPIKFGTLLEGGDSIQIALEQGHDQVLAALREMENRIELDIVALWPDLGPVLAEIGEAEEIKAQKKNAFPTSEDERFDLRVKVGRRVKALLDQRREACRHEIMDALLPQAEAHHVHPLMDDSMIMNVAVLVRKDHAVSLEARIAQLDQQYEDRINFRIIGPLPPYSFQTLEIRHVDYDLLNGARKTLELEEETTTVGIRDAYWKLTKKFHPDRCPGDANVQKHFEKINAAYKLVSDYCAENGCSFREQEVRKWMRVQPVEDRSPKSKVQSPRSNVE